jgi:protein-tyrosine-phosphatase
MAEAFARIHGGDQVEAYSAGSRPSGRVNPRAVAAMQLLGYDLNKHHSKGLEQFNGLAFDAAITMGCGDECPLVLAKERMDWQIPDPKDLSEEEFHKIRDLIESKVKELLSQREGLRYFSLRSSSM